MRLSAAAFMNQPPMWLSTASLKIRSRPTLASSTRIGTLPLRKPGTFADWARSELACSTACRRSACGTSTLSRTRLSESSSTCVAIAWPIEAKDVALPVRGLPVVRLAVLVIELLQAGHQADAAEVDLVRPRVIGDVVRLARAVGEVRDSVRAGDDRMGDPGACRSPEDVAPPQLVLLSLGAAFGRHLRRQKLERSRALEDDERLGLERVTVRRAAALGGLPGNPSEPRGRG